MFFLETAGFGSELSLSCANLCIDRGIPSPQQLAAFIHASSANDVLQWLKINQTHFMLLKIAVGSYLIEIQKACCACGVSTNMPAVWVDVDTPVVSTDGEGVEGAQEEEVKVERAMSGDHFDGAKPTMPEHSLLNNKDSSSCDQQDRPGTACGAYDWEGSSLSSYDHQQLTLTSTQMVDPCAEVSPLLTPASAVASAANSPLDFYAEAPWERSESSGSWVSGSLLSPAGRISSNNSWASCAFAGDHSVSVGKGKEDIAVDVEADDEVEVEVGMVAESVWWEEGPSFTASSALLDTSARYTADAQLQVAAQLPTAVEDSATALTVAVPTPVRSALRVV